MSLEMYLEAYRRGGASASPDRSAAHSGGHAHGDPLILHPTKRQRYYQRDEYEEKQDFHLNTPSSLLERWHPTEESVRLHVLYRMIANPSIGETSYKISVLIRRYLTGRPI